MVAVIVVGVILFLALDAYILMRVFRGMRQSDDYGSMPIPGELQVPLSAGTVKLTYSEDRRINDEAESDMFDVPAGVVVTVTGPSGEPVEVRGPGFKGMGSATVTGMKRSTALIGKFDVATPGTYTVSAQGDLAGVADPQVLVGK